MMLKFMVWEDLLKEAVRQLNLKVTKNEIYSAKEGGLIAWDGGKIDLKVEKLILEKEILQMIIVELCHFQLILDRILIFQGYGAYYF